MCEAGVVLAFQLQPHFAGRQLRQVRSLQNFLKEFQLCATTNQTFNTMNIHLDTLHRCLDGYETNFLEADLYII